MKNPPAYVKTPAADLGPPIRPHKIVAIGRLRAVRINARGLWELVRRDDTWSQLC